MNRDQALALLGLQDGAPAPAVRAAYATAVRASHPDTADGQPSGIPIAELKAARDLLLAGVATRPCKVCGGVGSIRGRLGAVTCTSCRGTGDETL